MKNNSLARVRSLEDWLYNPSEEDLVCVNRFHEIANAVFLGGYTPLDPMAPQPEDLRVKVANLLKAQLVLLGGDVIYVREGEQLHTLGDSVDLLAYYLHSDTKEALKAVNLLETNFQGYFPVNDGLVWRDVMKIVYPNGCYCFVNLKTLEAAQIDPEQPNAIYPEYGCHYVTEENFGPLCRFFVTLNQAVREEFFFEKTMMYHFNQPYREKSHVLVGGGGNGKSMFMGLVQRLYGDFALTDAPQPNFSGHAAAVVAYNFIGKRIVTFNDVGDPSSQFLEWLKRMITGNLEVKTPSGSWLSVPCNTNFLMETNHVPEVLNLEAHRRRFIIRDFPEDFRLKDWMTDEDLDALGDNGNISPADIINYMISIKPYVKSWTTFEQMKPIGDEDVKAWLDAREREAEREA